MNSFPLTFPKNLKVALVYDWIDTPYGGAEQVVQAFHEMFPSAPIFTSVYHPQKAHWANHLDIKPSFLNRVSIFKKNRYLALPFLPLAFESLNLQKFDLVISITSAFAKGVITRSDQLHLCYLLSPPRFLYEFNQNYQEVEQLTTTPILKNISRLVLNYTRWWDQAAMFRPDIVVPLSKLVQNRVQEQYQLQTHDPIYPPVNMIDLNLDEAAVAELNLPNNFCLVVSRLTSYKKIDLAIKACAQLDKNLVIVGEGPSKKTWQRLARQITDNQSLKSNSNKPTIIFLGSQPQPIVNSLMKRADLFLAPGIDDFGLSPLQANIFGKPAIINADSGVAEVFKPGIQGEVIISPTADSLAKSISQALSKKYNSAKMKSLALEHDKQSFQPKIGQLIQQQLISKN